MIDVREIQGKRGFTLIEILAAVAVLILVLAILFQISSSVLQSTAYSNQRMNAARTARVVLDSVESDLDQMVSEKEFSVFVRPDSNGPVNNTCLCLLTQSRGPRSAAAGRFTVVRYSLLNGVLMRDMSLVPWNSTDLLQELHVQGATISTELARGVIRFEAGAILDDGSVVSLASSGTPWLTSTVSGTTIPDNFKALRLASMREQPLPSTRRVRALVISVATVDEQIFSLLTNNGNDLAQKLQDPSTGETPAETWTRNQQDGSLNAFPRPVVKTLQISQKNYELK